MIRNELSVLGTLAGTIKMVRVAHEAIENRARIGRAAVPGHPSAAGSRGPTWQRRNVDDALA
ncbi:MAG: hypothetical protein ACR2KT_16015 [Methylocella sp.]|nr:MAG: hypothetical protein DLM68_16455 [Hyphomicrobiales bacterium]